MQKNAAKTSKKGLLNLYDASLEWWMLKRCLRPRRVSAGRKCGHLFFGFIDGRPASELDLSRIFTKRCVMNQGGMLGAVQGPVASVGKTVRATRTTAPTKTTKLHDDSMLDSSLVETSG